MDSMDDNAKVNLGINSHVYVYFGDAIGGHNEINHTYRVARLFSHEEIKNKVNE
jgi:hypothetical protein